MKRKNLLDDIEYMKEQATILERMKLDRTLARRKLIQFIRLHQSHLLWRDMYLSSRADSTLVEKFKQIIDSMEKETPK